MRPDVILKTLTSRVRFVKYVHTKPAKHKAIKKNLQKLRSPRYRHVIIPSRLAPRVLSMSIPLPMTPTIVNNGRPFISSGIPVHRSIFLRQTTLLTCDTLFLATVSALVVLTLDLVTSDIPCCSAHDF